MQIQALLEASDWQAIQSDWLALLDLAQFPREDCPWDLLLLSLDRHLNFLQRLTLKKWLSAEEQQGIESLVHARFDQVLEALNLQRQQQQPYLVQEQVYRGPFSRYRALGDLELRLKEVQRLLDLPQVPRKVRDHILHDMNLELLERFSLRQSPATRADFWQKALLYVVCLSWTEQELSAATAFLLQKQPEAEQHRELAQRVLKSSRFLHSQAAAVRLLMREIADPTLAAEMKTLLAYSETPPPVLLEILRRLPPQRDWQAALLELALRVVPEVESRARFEPVRQLALRKLAALSGLPDSDCRTLFERAQNWAADSRLLAIQVLAQSTLSGLFEEAIVLFKQAALQDDQPLLRLAAETLGVLQDGRAVSHLLAVLNGQYYQVTALERYRHAFAAEVREVYPFLLQTLEKLGQQVQQDPFSGRWVILN